MVSWHQLRLDAHLSESETEYPILLRLQRRKLAGHDFPRGRKVRSLYSPIMMPDRRGTGWPWHVKAPHVRSLTAGHNLFSIGLGAWGGSRRLKEQLPCLMESVSLL